MKETGQLLDAFLPVKLLARIHGVRGDLPAAIEFPAAVLFVDVSRYTALVEQSARRGQEGLEELPRLLSLSYARCTDQILDRGGEVIYFAGDALLAYWAADAGGLRGAVQAATGCADEICRDHNHGPNGSNGESGPALYLGVGAGQLWAAALGGEPMWSLVAGGDAVVQAANAEAVARRWEYVLSDCAVQALADVENISTGDPRSEFSAASASPHPEWLIDFLPPQLRNVLLGPATASYEGCGMDLVEARRVGAQLEALGEIRPVSVLFARILGLNPDDSRALSRYQTLCISLQEILRSRGGPPGELLFDDKGLIFKTAFGARGSFHRDDPSRALDAARAINLKVQSLGLSTSIGVASGDALFDFVGSVRRRQLMMHGSPVNRAARLMTAVSADVFCDAPTERASRSAFWFEERGTLQLDGLGDMAAIFRPLEQRAAVHAPGALIGREIELDVLKRTFGETRDGGRRLQVVLGEAGIGKTALVTAFVDELRSTGTAVKIVRAERDDRRTSLLPWRRVLASLLDLPSDIDGSLVFRRVAVRVQDDLSVVGRLPLLDGVLGIEIPENDATRHLEGAHRADATMRLLGDLVGALAPRPFALVLEDSQWLDSASWRLIEWVLASQPSMLWVLCVRSEEIPEELKNLQRRAEAARMNTSPIEPDDPARFCRVLDLGELSDASICELVARTLSGVPPHEELARKISALASGNPLFAEEVALTLKSEGLIAMRDGFWRPIRSLDDLQYFEGVERVIRERVDRLGSTALDVLKAAAVVGRSFAVDSLKALLSGELDEKVIEDSVGSMVAARFVREGSHSGIYEFRHDQIRDVVYGSTPSAVRQRLHGEMAEWIELNQSTATGADISILVQHFESAGNKVKAVKYADLAATRAFEVGAFREVEAFLEICFGHESGQLVGDPEQTIQAVRWRRQLAEAHYSRGDIHAQGIAVTRALTLAGEFIPRSRVAVVMSLLGNALRLAFQQLFPPSLSSTRCDAQQSWELEMARCLGQAAMVDYFELRFLPGMRHLIKAVIHAERAGNTTELAVASSQVACGLGILGQRRACEYFMARAERVAIALGDPAIHSHVCILDALWRVGHGHWSMVDRRLQESQDRSLQAGDQLRWCSAQVIRFWSLYYRGDWGALEHTAQALLSRAQNCGNIQQEIWALRCKSMCALHTDRPREAVEVLRLITSAMLGSADRAALVSSKGSLSLALARVGLHGESIQATEETLHLLREMRRPTAHSTLVGISSVCEVLLRGRESGLSREYDQWGDWEQQALHELKRYSRIFPIGVALYGLWVGVSHWLDGRKHRALSTWNQALVTARHLSLRQDEAKISAEIRRRQDRA